jgi:short subunit dehydrogenase-like uncharacterized protein
VAEPVVAGSEISSTKVLLAAVVVALPLFNQTLATVAALLTPAALLGLNLILCT